MKRAGVVRNDMCEVPLFRLHELRDAEDERDRLRAALKLIAETPESKNTIQVWAWQAYKGELTL